MTSFCCIQDSEGAKFTVKLAVNGNCNKLALDRQVCVTVFVNNLGTVDMRFGQKCNQPLRSLCHVKLSGVF